MTSCGFTWGYVPHYFLAERIDFLESSESDINLLISTLRQQWIVVLPKTQSIPIGVVKLIHVRQHFCGNFSAIVQEDYVPIPIPAYKLLIGMIVSLSVGNSHQ